MKATYKVGKGVVEVVQGSITDYPADALVCPANPDFEMVAFPGGVQFAFLRNGGVEIFEEAVEVGKKLNMLIPKDSSVPLAVPPTSAHLTGAGRLPAKYVIHVVSVDYDLTNNRAYCNGAIVGRSTKNALTLAKENKLVSIGFPALGTGLYDVPLEESVESMGNEFIEHLQGKTTLERIGLVLYVPRQYTEGKIILEKLLI